MTTIQIFLIILLLEILTLCLCFIATVINRFASYFVNRRREKEKEKLSMLILKALQDKHVKTPPLSRSLAKPKQLIAVLHSFDLRFQGGKWEEIKIALVEKWLLPKARRWYKSLFWEKRYLAARSFAFYSHPQDISMILTLMNDHSFLVESSAALAAIRLEHMPAVDKIIKRMSHGTYYAKVYYRDILLQGSNKVFFHIEKLLSSTKVEDVQMTCLDLLSAKTMPIRSPIVNKAISSKNSDLRFASISLHAHNPQVSSVSVLQDAIADKESRIRRQAAFGLGVFPTPKNFILLKKALDDMDWFVRLEAAKSLKKMGSKGMKILKQCESSHLRRAKQVSAYVLHLPLG